jgi:hypothetical protein
MLIVLTSRRKEYTMGYYKREVSLMDPKLFPRDSLDKPIENPNRDISIHASPIPQTNEEIVNYVVSDLKKALNP